MSEQHHKISYLEIPTTDVPVTKKFFSTVFGWTTFTDYGDEYTSFQAEGINGGFYRADTVVTASHGAALVVLYSSNLSDTQRRVTAAGGTITRPTFSFPGGFRFHFTDPTGNEFAVWSDKKS